MIYFKDWEPAMTKTEQVLQALREHYESDETGKDGSKWGLIYLDNAWAALEGMSANQFRSHLAQLSKQGLYKVVDGYAWGCVKLEGSI
jgi:hypothetical protein